MIETVATLRERYEQAPDPDESLDAPSIKAELRGVHEAVIGEGLLKDTFRRWMEPQVRPKIDDDGRPVLRRNGGRPAQVYAHPERRKLDASARRRLLLPSTPG